MRTDGVLAISALEFGPVTPFPNGVAIVEGDVANPAHRRHRYLLAEMLRRVFHIDVFLCECGGLRRLLAAILDPDPVRRILLHLGLPADPPAVAPARPPPATALPRECRAPARFVAMIAARPQLMVRAWRSARPAAPT